MIAPRYRLAGNVFACFSDNRIVFLDLNRDKYFCLSESNTAIIRPLLATLTEADGFLETTCTVRDDRQADEIIGALTRGGILTTAAAGRRKTFAPARLQRVERVLRHLPDNPQLATGGSHVAAFFYASLTASWQLRFKSMLRIVHDIDSHKRLSRIEPSDEQIMSQLAAMFQCLRPYYFRRYRCLYDSLALIHFLSIYRLYPDLVFAVKSQPFGAHCWVQHGNAVLNDSVEFVREYTPIMLV